MIILGPVAVSDNLVIGSDNDLPWYFPEDLKKFKEITMGKTVVMGRKTYESIVKRIGKPLPGRKNVVISRQTDFKAPEGVLVFDSLEKVIEALKNEDLYIIGGAQIFKLALPYAEKMYMTHVHGSYRGDAYFLKIDWSQWEKMDEDRHTKFTFAVYQKIGFK
jgi:dihydrofolate reductase